jgi:hypothetical protein
MQVRGFPNCVCVCVLVNAGLPDFWFKLEIRFGEISKCYFSISSKNRVYFPTFSDLKEKSRYFPSREKNLQQTLLESEMPTLPSI